MRGAVAPPNPVAPRATTAMRGTDKKKRRRIFRLLLLHVEGAGAEAHALGLDAHLLGQGLEQVRGRRQIRVDEMVTGLLHLARSVADDDERQRMVGVIV